MKYPIFDAHCDTLCRVRDEGSTLDKNQYHIDLERMGENYTQVFACYIAPQYKNEAMSRFLELCDIFHNSCTNGILSIENGQMIDSPAALRNVKRLGAKIIAPVWNFENHIATGVLGNPDRGFTDFGKKLIHEMNEENILIDYSHMNDASFFDAAKISDMPIIATHSNSRAVCSHPRNLTDEQFKMIVASGGCVGINFYPPFLSNDANAKISDIIRHINHFLELGGENCIGLGSDFDGVDALPEDISDCRDMDKIICAMEQEGYSDELIHKICHKNWERIFNT